MPPKRKKLGRPPGSKNKKSSNKNRVHFKSVMIAKKKNDKSSAKKIKYVCNVCNKEFPTGKAMLTHRVCQKGLQFPDVIFTKVNKV